jgi:Flp pilus assembly protein TadD
VGNAMPQMNSEEAVDASVAAFHRGMAAIDERDFPRAIAEFSEVIRLAPTHAPARVLQSWFRAHRNRARRGRREQR